MQFYVTEFQNKSKGTIVVNEEGRELLRLEPGEKKYVESRDASTSYAAWSRITYEKDGAVSLKENHDWKFPLQAGMLMLTILNIDGAQTEQFYTGAGEAILCYKGVPRYVAIRCDDPQWALVARMEIKNVEHKEKDGDYFKTKTVLEKVKTLLSKSEIKGIEKLLVDEAIARAKLDFKRRFTSAEL